MISIEQWRARIGTFNCKRGYSGFLSSLFSSSSYYYYQPRKRRNLSREAATQVTFTSSPAEQHLPSYPAQTQRPVHGANQHLPAACIPSTGEHDGRLIPSILPMSTSVSTNIATSSPPSPPYSIPPSFSSDGVLSLQCSLLRDVLILLIAIIFQQLIISGDIESNPGPVSRPTMNELIWMRKRDGSKGGLRIIDWITAHQYTQCVDFAHKLLVDKLSVKELSVKHSDDKDGFVRAVIKRWLDRDDDDEDEESMPCTWEALVQCAHDAGLDGDFVKLLRDNVPYDELEHSSIAASLQTVQQRKDLDLHLLHLILHGLPSTGKTCAKLSLTGQLEELRKRKPATISDSGKVSYSNDDGTRSTLLADDIVRARIPAADTAVASKVIVQPWYLLPLPEELVLMATKMEKRMENKPKEKDLSAKGLQSSSEQELPAPVVPREVIPTPRDFEKIVTTAFKEAPHTDLQHLLAETLLYLIDSGGQPQFQELLPTLISGPSLFLLTFSLAVGLDAEFQVTFTDSNSRREYPTSMKVSDALLQCLASICCTCSYQTNGVNAVEVKPRVIFMATMKNLVTESDIDAIDTKLYSLLAPYKDEDIIVYNAQRNNTSEKRPSCLFPIDSFADKGIADEGIPALRQAVKEVANSSVMKVITGEPPRRQRLCEVTLPAPTVALELVLRFQSNEKSIITLDECKRIARDCNISDTELPNVLWHLHHFTGSIRYYPEHDRLRNYVVTRPQALYDIPSTLLTDTFAFSKNVECCKRVKDMVWTRGVFTMDTLRRLWNKDQDISPDLIIDFLLHLNIIARIQDEEEGEKFFMPCALVCAAPENSSKRVVQEDSMLVCFKCKYTPKGTYSSLLACLLKKPENIANEKPENVAKEKPEKDSIDLEWILPTVKGSLCSNQAKLRVKVDDDEFDFIVKLTIHHKFIEINVSYDDDEPVPPTKMLQYYMAILDHIQLTVKTVVEDLHYNSNAKLCNGLFFPCFCDHEVDAHAVKFEKRKGSCQGLKVKPAESWVQKWIKGTTTVNQPQPSISQPPPPVATENTMSVVGADPQATLTAGNKRLFVEVDDREQTPPAAQKPCLVQDDITTDSQITCAGTKRPLAADKPTIQQLITVNKRDGTELRIIDTFTAHSKFQLENFADILLNNTTIVKRLKKQYTNDDEFIQEVLKHWLALDVGGPALARTWEALGQCVSKAGLDGTFAKAIRETYYPDPPAESTDVVTADSQPKIAGNKRPSAADTSAGEQTAPGAKKPRSVQGRNDEEKSANKMIFISYGREPGVSNFVQQMKKDMESNGFTVWLDTNDISAGSDWRGEISKGVSKCQAFVPVLTEKYRTSPYCNKELDAADTGKKMVFPILYEDVDLSSEPWERIRFMIGSINYIKCRPNLDDYSSSVHELMLSMQEKGVGSSLVTITPPPKMLELNVDNVLKKLTQHGFSATKWHDLAASLGQGSAVKEIKTDESGGSSDKLNALITYWLDNDMEPSWEKLVIAMEESKQKAAARKLARDIGIPYPVKK